MCGKHGQELTGDRIDRPPLLHQDRCNPHVARGSHALHARAARDDAVGMLDDRRARTEIAGERKISPRPDMRSKGLDQLRPRSGETEDGLGVVANGKYARAVLRVNELEDFDLNLGGILKLVDQETGEARGQRPGDHRLVAKKAIRFIDDAGEVDKAELLAAPPEMGRGACHGVVAQRQADKVAVRIEAKGFESLEIAGIEVEEIYLLRGVAHDSLELRPVAGEHPHGPGEARHEPRERAQDFGEAECMDCAYRIVRVIAVEEVRGDTLLDLLHRGVCVGDAGGGAWRST